MPMGRCWKTLRSRCLLVLQHSNLVDVIHHIENSRNSMQLCLNFSLTTGTWVTEALCRLRASSWEQTPLLEPSTRRWCPTPRRLTCPLLLRQQPSGCVTWCMNAFVYMETRKEFFSCYWTKWQKNVVLKDKTGKFYGKRHRHRAIRAMEPLRKPSPQCVDLLEHIWQFSKTYNPVF